MKDKIRTYGSNSEKALLLVHGGPGLSDNYFEGYLSDVAEKFKIYSYTQSEVVPKIESVSDLSQELQQVIEFAESEAQQLFILGHSGGAALVFHTMEELERAWPLILVDWVWDRYWIQLFTEKFKLADDCMKEIAEKNQQTTDPNEQLRNILLGYIDAYFPKSHKDAGEKLFRTMKLNAQIYFDLQQSWLSRLDYSFIVDQLDGKRVLSLSGSEDSVTCPEYYEDLKLLNKKIKHNVIEGAGHFPFIEKDKEVSELILKFMTKIKPLG